ncbi:retrotransposon protein [Hordeum vulgare]|nr:retrotransposon protein [Hordeum vulgare]
MDPPRPDPIGPCRRRHHRAVHVEVVFQIPTLEGAKSFEPNWLLNPQSLCGEKGASVPGSVGPLGLLVMASGDMRKHTDVFFRMFRQNDKYKVLMCTDLSKSSTRDVVYKPPYGVFVDMDIEAQGGGGISLRTLVNSSNLLLCFRQLDGHGTGPVLRRVWDDDGDVGPNAYGGKLHHLGHQGGGWSCHRRKLRRQYLLRALADDLLLQVASKKTAAEIWASLRTRFVGADRVRAARLGTLRGEFELLRMAEAETLDAFAGRLGGMAARYAELGSTLEDSALVKKLLDSVPDRLYAAVARIEQFCDVGTMLFEDALGQLNAFDERLQRRGQTGGEREDGQLMLTVDQWRARERRRGGGRDDDDDGNSVASNVRKNLRGRCYHCDERGHFKRDYPHRRKGPAAEEHALLGDVDVENAGLL